MTESSKLSIQRKEFWNLTKEDFFSFKDTYSPKKDGYGLFSIHRYIGMFESELNGCKLKGASKIYVEVKENLYVLHVDENWKSLKEKYIPITKEGKETFVYNVNFYNFVPVSDLNSSKQKEYIYEFSKDKEDDYMKDLSIRDIYSILNNVPESNKKWLNELIIKYK